jgi:lantibiotic modifying enzyme
MTTEFLLTADRIAARLARDALWQGACCNWTGDAMEFVQGGWQVVHRALGFDLYGGAAGVGLFMAHMHRATGERLYASVASAALASADAQWRRQQGAATAFYSGGLGLAWAMLRTAEIVDTPAWAERGAELLHELCDQPPTPGMLDVTSGSAGVICALLDLLPQAPSLGLDRDRLLACAHRHARHLLDAAVPGERGLHWPAPGGPVGSLGLCGLSHGTAGIAWALRALHAASADARYLAAAAGAHRYERSWFDAGEQNWPDLRSLYDPTLGDGKRLGYMNAWCHGAPGVGLARLACHGLDTELAPLAEIQAALRTTRAGLALALSTGQGNFSLCHGHAGNADLLIEAGQRLGDAEALELARQVGTLGRQLYDDAPWPCGVLNGGETPSLMLGLAGIGWFYLRLHDPALPSVLVLPDLRTPKTTNPA